MAKLNQSNLERGRLGVKPHSGRPATLVTGLSETNCSSSPWTRSN